MRQRKYSIIVFLLFLFIAVQPGWSEQISLKFSFKTNSIADDDLNTWIHSNNNLWRDWQDNQGGELTGAFVPLSYGPGFEIEVRIPIFKGLALNFGGSTKFSDAQEELSRWKIRRQPKYKPSILKTKYLLSHLR